MIRTGGGRFDPKEENVYFIASNAERLQHAYPVYNHVLLAVNELESGGSMQIFLRALGDANKKVFLDSGVYNLAMTHAKKHGVSHNEGLAMAPSEIEGFNELFTSYVDIASSYEDKLWGYVEIDQGGRENKIKTRTRLEALGLHPIPVYHPLNDGWEYFDYLAERYDRICFGNVVKADRTTRLRLVATAWERHRKYPDLWIHFLGLTPNEWLNAFPMNSGDSSTWIAPLRWPTFPVSADGCSVGGMNEEYRYVLGSDPTIEAGSQKAAKLCGYQSAMNMRTWRHHIRDLETIGCEVYP